MRSILNLIVIGEPTQTQIHIAHKGTARVELIIKGRGCHSSTPLRGVNAIHQMMIALQAIEAYSEQLKDRAHPLLGAPSIAVTTISGGDKDNVIPNRCAACIDRRTVPGEDGDSAEKEIRAVLSRVGARLPAFDWELKRYICLEAGSIDADHPCVQRAKRAFRQCFQEDAVVASFPASCEQAIFSRYGVPAFIFGPGSIHQAREADEYVEIDQLYKAAAFYEGLARELMTCGGNSYEKEVNQNECV